MLARFPLCQRERKEEERREEKTIEQATPQTTETTNSRLSSYVENTNQEEVGGDAPFWELANETKYTGPKRETRVDKGGQKQPAEIRTPNTQYQCIRSPKVPYLYLDSPTHRPSTQDTIP